MANTYNFVPLVNIGQVKQKNKNLPGTWKNNCFQKLQPHGSICHKSLQQNFFIVVSTISACQDTFLIHHPQIVLKTTAVLKCPHINRNIIYIDIILCISRGRYLSFCFAQETIHACSVYIIFLDTSIKMRTFEILHQRAVGGL